MTRAILRMCVCAYAVLAASAAPIGAWHAPGHVRATTAAVTALKDKLPAFFVASADIAAGCAVDPDLFRLRIHPQLRNREAPDHYFDRELVAGWKLPTTRYEFIAMCAVKGRKVAEVGMAPYAVVEWTQRLTLALAEHRRWPGDPGIRAKCLVYAGLLAHYATDLCQPLHVTIHFDGRVGADGKGPRTGIHAKVDALLSRAAAQTDKTLKDARIAAYEDLLPAVLAQIERTAGQVDKVYQLDKQLPDGKAPAKLPPAVAAFADERLRAAARFVASLYLTAWVNSAKVRLPSWLDRARPKRPVDRKHKAAAAPSRPARQGSPRANRSERPLQRREESAVDVEDLAVDEVRRVGGKEHGRADQLGRIAPAARRRP